MTIETTQGAVANGAQTSPVAALMGGGGMTATGRAEVAGRVAEVLALVQVAQAVPRDLDRAWKRIESSCRRYAFAKRAFYSYPRGNRFDEATGRWVPNIITGKSVYLAREMAASFGNMRYGLVEVDRDTERGLAVMRAFAWDVENNVDTSSTFVVRHVRDKTARDARGNVTERIKEPLFDERDLYERNANDGARRVRAAIFAILPAWLVDEAADLCTETIARGPNDPETGKPVPLPVRLSRAVDQFAETFGIRKEQLEEHVGAAFPKWGPHDLARLLVLYDTLIRGELTVDQAFPSATAVSADDVASQAGGQGEGEPGLLSDTTRLEIDRLFTELGWGGQGNRARRQRVAGHLAAQRYDDVPARVGKWADLNEAHGQAALAGLRRVFTEVPADGRTARLEELDAEARQAAATPDDGDRPATTETLVALANRFAEGERDGAEHADLRAAVTAMAVHGHWSDLVDITEAQARYAIGRIDASFADARRREETLPVRLDRMYAAAIRERDRAEQGDAGDDPGGGPDSGEPQ